MKRRRCNTKGCQPATAFRRGDITVTALFGIRAARRSAVGTSHDPPTKTAVGVAPRRTASSGLVCSVQLG
eukprot:scaffold114785_cov75-Phaeocystis_antarctica.AAC.5